MKILLVQKVKGIAGSERYFFNMIPLLEKRGLSFEFLVLTDANGGHHEFVKTLKEMGIPCHTSRFQGVHVFSFFKKLRKVSSEGNFDAIHGHLIHADFYLALAKMCKVVGLPLLSTKHGYDEYFQQKFGFETSQGPIKNLYYFTALFAERYIDASFAVSLGVARLYEKFGITKYLPTVIHHGVEECVPSSHSLKDSSGCQIIVLGRLIPSKGIDLLISAIEKLDSRHGLEVLIVGSGEAEMTLRSLVENKSLADVIKFLGFQKKPETFLNSADFMVLPARGEGFGLVAIEAFAHGIPIVAFDVPAINEIVTHGENGFLVPPFDVEMLAKRIDALVEDSALRQAMGAAALKSAKEEFNLGNCAEKTADFYYKNHRG